MTMSPSWRGAFAMRLPRSPRFPRAGGGREVRLAGNESTLVGASRLSHLSLSARIAESSVNTIASSACGVEADFVEADLVEAATRMACRTRLAARECRRHCGEATMTSTSGADFRPPAGGLIP